MDQVSELPKKPTYFNLNQLESSHCNKFESFCWNKNFGYKKSLFAQQKPKETKSLNHLHHYNQLNVEALTFQRQVLANVLETTQDPEAIVIKARRKQDYQLSKDDKSNGSFRGSSFRGVSKNKNKW